MNRNFFFTLIVALFSCHAFCQAPPQEFFKGLNEFTNDPKQAKKDLLAAIVKNPQFHGSYHFLGVIYLDENNPDSAIWYFKTSLALNTGNINHTKEITYVRLISTYVYLHNFSTAFDTAWAAYKLYDDNKSIASQLKDICLWSFYIKADHLNPSYLAPEVKKEYEVNNIPEEYLIYRWLKSGNEYLNMGSQSLKQINKLYYDVFSCTLSTSKKPIEVLFKINWDMNIYYGGKEPPTNPTINDTNSTVYEKAGAMLVADDKTDLKTAIEKFLN